MRISYTAAPCPVMSTQLLTVTQAAAYLNVSTATVYRLVGRGELDARRVGRQLRFDPAELDDYTRQPAAPAMRGAGSFASRLAAMPNPYAA